MFPTPFPGKTGGFREKGGGGRVGGGGREKDGRGGGAHARTVKIGYFQFQGLFTVTILAILCDRGKILRTQNAGVQLSNSERNFPWGNMNGGQSHDKNPPGMIPFHCTPAFSLLKRTAVTPNRQDRYSINICSLNIL